MKYVLNGLQILMLSKIISNNAVFSWKIFIIYLISLFLFSNKIKEASEVYGVLKYWGTCNCNINYSVRQLTHFVSHKIDYLSCICWYIYRLQNHTRSHILALVWVKCIWHILNELLLNVKKVQSGKIMLQNYHQNCVQMFSACLIMQLC